MQSPIENPWGWWRAQMPITKEWTYLDHAAVAPLCQPAADAIGRFAHEAATAGDTVWPTWAKRVEETRTRAAELVGADRSEVCLVPNTTAGINLIAEGFPWKSGDNVVVPEGEFPSNLWPWLNQRAKGVEVRIVDRHRGEARIDDLIERADGRTRMIAASWVGFASGNRLDLEQLVDRAHRRGILVFLDAIQGLGIYPLDLRETPVDFLAADGHKWLLGPEGAGIAVVRREHLDLIRCTSVGWNSSSSPHAFSASDFEFRNDAARFEGGSANMVGLAALGAALEMFLTVTRIHGPDAIARRVLATAESIQERLHRLGIASRFPKDPARRSGIVTFRVPGWDPAAFRKLAMDRGIVLSCRDGGVRASVHAYHDEGDLDRFEQALRDAAQV